MKVLFLDDNEKRWEKIHGEFSKLLPENPISEMEWAKTAEQCIHLLKTGNWDVVSLDHDLGGKSNSDYNSSESGSEVVRWIQENRPDVGLFIVHSWNIPAAKVMNYKLYKAGYQTIMKPFGL